MPKKIVYFTTGVIPTEGEALEIQQMQDAIAAYTLTVVNAQASPNYGEHPEVFDYRSGLTNPPDPYDSLPVIEVADIAGTPPASGTQTVRVGPEDSITKIDLNNDGKPDVIVVVDNPPQA